MQPEMDMGPPLYVLIPMGIIAFLVIVGTCVIFGFVIYRIVQLHRRRKSRQPHIYRPPRTPYNNTTVPIITHGAPQETRPPPAGWSAPPPPYNPNYPPPPNAPSADIGLISKHPDYKNNSLA